MEEASNRWIGRRRAMLLTNATSTIHNNVSSQSQCTVRGSKYFTEYWHGVLNKTLELRSVAGCALHNSAVFD